MKLKVLGLLIFFVLSISATIYADSMHVATPTFGSSVALESDHNESNSPQSDHCSDHPCGHHHHNHIYLNLSHEISIPLYSFVHLYPSFNQSFIEIHLEVVKPPVV